jgi:hypothetical protein
MDRNLHSQTVSGLPVALQGYDGDLSLVYHGLSMSTSANSITLTSIDTITNLISGWRMTLYDGNIQVVIGREGSGNDMTSGVLLTDQMPFAGKIHTFSFVYIADNGSGVSSLRVFWDGVSIVYTEKAYSPLRFDTSNGIYMGRYFNYPIFSTTYNAGHKIFKRALTEAEMLDQHRDIPTEFDKLPITNNDEAYIVFTIDNENMDGFIIRISSMFPYNTENRFYKKGFLDTVKI